MDAFQAGRYQQACEQLVLADAAASSDLSQRIYLRLWHVYACIAAQQYAQAVNSVSWLLQREPDENVPAGAQTLNRFRDIRSFYGQPGDYVEHSRILERFAAANRERPDMAVLEAMWAWGRGDTVNAKWHARRFIEALDRELAQRQTETSLANQGATSWHRLVALFEEAEKIGAPTPAIPAPDLAPDSQEP